MTSCRSAVLFFSLPLTKILECSGFLSQQPIGETQARLCLFYISTDAVVWAPDNVCWHGDDRKQTVDAPPSAAHINPKGNIQNFQCSQCWSQSQEFTHNRTPKITSTESHCSPALMLCSLFSLSGISLDPQLKEFRVLLSLFLHFIWVIIEFILSKTNQVEKQLIGLCVAPCPTLSLKYKNRLIVTADNAEKPIFMQSRIQSSVRWAGSNWSAGQVWCGCPKMFVFIHLYITIRIVSRCFPEAETQSLDPQVSTVTGKTPFNIWKPWPTRGNHPVKLPFWFSVFGLMHLQQGSASSVSRHIIFLSWKTLFGATICTELTRNGWININKLIAAEELVRIKKLVTSPGNWTHSWLKC